MIDSRFTIWWTDLICFKCLLKLSGRFSPKSRHSWGYHNLLYQLRGTYCHISLIFPTRPYDRIWSLFLRPLPPAALEPERDHLALGAGIWGTVDGCSYLVGRPVSSAIGQSSGPSLDLSGTPLWSGCTLLVFIPVVSIVPRTNLWAKITRTGGASSISPHIMPKYPPKFGFPIS